MQQSVWWEFLKCLPKWHDFKLGISRKKLAVLALAIGFVFYGHLCTMHFIQEQQQQQQKTFNFLKRTLTTLGAAILFCLVAVQGSVSDSESAPNTVTKHQKALFGNVPLHSEALCNARLMQLIPGLSRCRLTRAATIRSPHDTIRNAIRASR